MLPSFVHVRCSKAGTLVHLGHAASTRPDYIQQHACAATLGDTCTQSKPEPWQGFAERAAGLVDLNERALTLRTGGLRSDDDDGGGRGYPDQYGQGGRCGAAGCLIAMLRGLQLGFYAVSHVCPGRPVRSGPFAPTRAVF